jgi:hypothetical protein
LRICPCDGNAHTAATLHRLSGLDIRSSGMSPIIGLQAVSTNPPRQQVKCSHSSNAASLQETLPLSAKPFASRCPRCFSITGNGT